jgi:transposase-like protein
MEPTLDLASLAKQFSDEDTARAYLEDLRWPNGPVCAHCGATEPYRIAPGNGSKTRKGLWKCKVCQKQFTVTVGTIFEDSHIPLSKWLLAIHLLCASKKGMSAHQLHRMLGITYKSAWFMAHRIRYAMTQPPLVDKLRGIVEADETYIGGKRSGRAGRGALNKTPVVALVERKGRVRSFPMDRVTGKNLRAAIREHVDPSARLMTDDFIPYKTVSPFVAQHDTITHSKKEYVRGEVHTNTVENFFSIVKRGIVGVYQHVGKQHLHRYLNEFSFRYSNRDMKDGVRAVLAAEWAKGKRLTYRPLVQGGKV